MRNIVSQIRTIRMNYLTRFGDRHDRKDKKMPDRSQSVEPTSTPLSPDSNPRRRLDKPSTPTSGPGRTPKEPDLAFVEEVDNEDGPHLPGKRRTVSVSRSGRYKSKSKSRTILSDEVYSGMSVGGASPTSPCPPQPPTQPQKDSVKPVGLNKSPARPYIILKSDSSVNFAIESTSL